jgi:hypothetical protein
LPRPDAVRVGCRGRDGSPDAQAAASPAPRSDVSVKELSLERALEAIRRVIRPLEAFVPADTVYSSVVTEGSARRGLLKANWHEHAKVASEASLDIAPSATTASELQISRPGLPPGRHQVETFFDGAPAGKRTFPVQ